MYIIYEIETHKILGQYDKLAEALEVLDTLALMGIQAEVREEK